MDTYSRVVDEVRQGIEDVLSGENYEDRFELANASMVQDIAEELGLVKVDMEVHGWEGNFNISMEKDGKEYSIYANGFYGGVSFTSNNDEDEEG